MTPEDGFACEISNAPGCPWTVISKSRKWKTASMSISRGRLNVYRQKMHQKEQENSVFADVEHPPRYSVRLKKQQQEKQDAEQCAMLTLVSIDPSVSEYGEAGACPYNVLLCTH